jgi:hypothetical protein
MAVWVSGEEQEAIRDLPRARQHMKSLTLKARQCLVAFQLRQRHDYPQGKIRWIQAACRRLETVKF